MRSFRLKDKNCESFPFPIFFYGSATFMVPQTAKIYCFAHAKYCIRVTIFLKMFSGVG